MANPTWFDVDTYMANKLAQIQAIEPKGAWTEEKLKKAFEDNGYKGDEGVFQHFIDFGMDENVSPNAQFDAVFYLRAKADQLNTIMQDGKSDWSVVNVLDAINAAGMNVWEHYVNFGSQEGIAASAGFDSTKYVIEKTKLMNETKEGGRANWTVAEVQAAFAENGLSALEHYNLFGQAEFKAAGKEIGDIKATEPTTKADGFHLYSGAQDYTLEQALAAHADGSLSAKYMLTNLATDPVDAGMVTVAQQATLKAFIAAAENGADYAKFTVTYDLQDTVANIDAASGTVKANADTVNIMDTLANVVAGDDALVNGVDAATGTVVFGAKAASADGKTAADVVTTTVKYDDIDGKNDPITIEHADKAVSPTEWTNKGDAVVSVDASAETATATINLGSMFTTTLDNVTFNAIGGKGADTITAHVNGGVLIGGAGVDALTGGAGVDVFAYTATTFDALKLEAGATGDTISTFTTGTDSIQLTKAIEALLTTTGDKINLVAASSGTLTAGDGARLIINNGKLILDQSGDTTATGGSLTDAANDDIVILTGINNLAVADIHFA